MQEQLQKLAVSKQEVLHCLGIVVRHSASLSPPRMPVRGTRERNTVVDVTDSRVLNTTR